MRAKALAHGAVTIVNAIPSGLGAAMGIDLWTEAVVEFGGSRGVEVVIEGFEEEDEGLVEKVIELVMKRAGLNMLGARVRTRSNIPIGKGLKSSSAAANAVALAASKALNMRLGDEEIILLGVEAALEAGVSITGAYDDAYTSYFGGLNVTDNLSRKVLARLEAPENLRVLILVPEERLYTRDVDVEALRRLDKISRTAIDLALRHRFWEAMTLNGFLVAGALRIDPAPMMEALRRGALAAGVSGTGPSIAAVCPPNKVEGVREAFEAFGEVLEARVNNEAAEVEVL